MRTTIDLPDDLLRRAKATAALRGMKLKDLITSFVERGLGQPEVSSSTRPAKRKLPDTIRRGTGTPIPAMTNGEIESFIAQEDARNVG
ncbi:MAG TPA: hypothetical protein VMI31_06035 [Fimbriimonadaceae bacterium]|nr:hypothetical protein [Fimbriimonadaceae bacterium]